MDDTNAKTPLSEAREKAVEALKALIEPCERNEASWIADGRWRVPPGARALTRSAKLALNHIVLRSVGSLPPRAPREEREG